MSDVTSKCMEVVKKPSATTTDHQTPSKMLDFDFELSENFFLLVLTVLQNPSNDVKKLFT